MNDRNGWRQSPPGATAQSVKDFAHRLVTLGELQGELLKVDAQDAVRGLMRPAVALLSGVVVAVSSVPILLLSVTFALHEWAGLSLTVSAAIATLSGLLIAAICFLVGWKLLQKGMNVFERSRQEFRMNLEWLKEALKQNQPEGSDCASVL